MRQRLDKECDQINAMYTVQANYSKTLALLAALKAGEVSLDEV